MMKYFPLILIIVFLGLISFFGFSVFPNLVALFTSQLSLNSLILCFFAIGLLVEVLNLNDVQRCHSWVVSADEKDAPGFIQHAARYISGFFVKNIPLKSSLSFSDFQGVMAYLRTQFSIKNKTSQSLIWAMILFSLIGSGMLMVTFIPSYIAQNIDPSEMMKTDRFVMILPLILSQFDDIFFPFLLGCLLSFTLSFHQLWTQLIQQKFIAHVEDELSGFLSPVERNVEDVSSLQNTMQEHVNHLRSELSSLTKGLDLKANSEEATSS